MSARRVASRLLAVGVTAATILGVVNTGVASAATFALVSSTPQDTSIVQSASSIKLCFSAQVNPVLSTVTVSGGPTAANPATPTTCNSTGDGLTVAPMTPAMTFMPGTYTVNYSATDTTVPTANSASGTLHFRIDNTAPAVPTITSWTHPINSANVTAVAVSGTTDPSTAASGGVEADNITVNLTVSDGTHNVTAATTSAAGTGNYSFSNVNVSSLADGSTISYSVTATDTANNASTAGTKTGVTKDTAPLSLTATVPAAGGTHKTTSTILLTFNKALDQANSSAIVKKSSGFQIATMPATFPTTQELQLTTLSPMDESGNPYTVTYTVQDADGNPASGSFQFAIDNTAPAAPSNVVVTNPINLADEAHVSVSGNAESGSTVNVDLTDGTNDVTASGTAANGSFLINDIDTTGLADTTITVHVTATDAALNTSPPTTVTTPKDTVAPTQPSNVTFQQNPINHANQTAVTVTATVSADTDNATISVDDNGDVNTLPLTQADLVPDVNHVVSATFDVSSLDEGTLTATVSAFDNVGNQSTPATGTATKDTGVPAAPAVTISPKPINASNATVTVSGTAEKSSTVDITLDDGDSNTPPLTFETTADPTTGAYSHGFAASGLSDGTITASVTATDAAGNVSAPGTDSTTKDTAAPNPPAGLTAPAYANIANSSAYPISGTAEKGSTVNVSVSDGTHTAHASTTASNADGSWSVSPDVTALSDGVIHISATATDAVGNVSTPATADKNKDTVAPAAPAVDTAPVQVSTANQHALTVAGNASATEAGATLGLSIDDAGDANTAPVTAQTTAAGNGSYSFTNVDVSSLDDGQLTFTVSATDVAGNPSSGNTQFTATKDTIQLGIVSHTPSSPTQSPATVTGTFNEPLDPNASTITVFDNGNSAAAGTTSFTNGNKTIVFTPSSPLPEAGGPYSVIISAKDWTDTDTFGGGPAPTFTFTVDNTPPAKPVVSTVTNPVNHANQAAVAITGTAEAGSTITASITDGTTTVHPTGLTDGGGAFSITNADVSSLADGPLSVTVTATDAAGNVSVASDPVGTTKDTVAPAAPVISSVTNPITASNVMAVAVSGTAEANSEVALDLTDGTSDVLVDPPADSHGNWSATGIDVSSLSDGTISVTATATDAAGNTSATSTPVTTPKHTVLPSAPQGLVVTPGDASLDISWTPPASDGGSAVTSYTVIVTPHGSSTPASTTTPSSSPAHVTGLTNGALYDVTVAATNGAGTGPTVAGSGTPRTVADAPTGVHVVAGDTQATVSWTAPASDGGTPITSYTVTANPGAVSLTSADGTARSLTLHGLANGVTYAFTVTANNIVGPGASSAGVTGTPKFATTLTIGDNHRSLVYGVKLAVFGSVHRTSNGAPISGAAVVIHRISDTGQTGVVTTAFTNSSGIYSATFAPAVDLTYYATFAGDSADFATTSGRVRTTVAPRVTITSPANNTTSSHLTTLSVRGTVKPSKIGATVTLYYVNARHQLVKLATTKVVRGSSFAFSVKLGRGTWHLTVVIGPTLGNIAGRSGTLTVFRT